MKKMPLLLAILSNVTVIHASSISGLEPNAPIPSVNDDNLCLSGSSGTKDDKSILKLWGDASFWEKEEVQYQKRIKQKPLSRLSPPSEVIKMWDELYDIETEEEIPEKQLIDTTLHLTSRYNILDMKLGSDGTALVISSRRKHPGVTKMLLKQGAYVNEVNSEGKSALHIACRFKRAETINILLEHKANIYKKDNAGLSPIAISAIYCDSSAVEKLLLKNKYVLCADKYYPYPDRKKVIDYYGNYHGVLICNLFFCSH